MKNCLLLLLILGWFFPCFSQCYECPNAVDYRSDGKVVFTFAETPNTISDHIILHTASGKEDNSSFEFKRLAENEYFIFPKSDLEKEIAFNIEFANSINCPFYLNQSVKCSQITQRRLVCPTPTNCDFSGCTQLIERLQGLTMNSQNYNWAYNSARNIYRYGRVGIGMNEASPNFGVSVKGGTLTHKFVVQYCDVLGWCDYVFAPSYSLEPLDNVEKYINQNKRLPGFKGASEYERDGSYNVEDITIAQQVKIEEAYLYILELKSRIEELKTITHDD